MPKCERCNKNDARVRFDAIVNGRREQHFFCRQCAEELMGEQMNALGGMGAGPFGGLFGGMGEGGPFGFAPQGGQRTATAQRTADKHSKTPTLDQFGRDLTAEA
ncbi:MAG TPA: ATP-dependent Clp protease ATP-binding subunit, partial [Dehalococcoidia bacterium]|nr:ATP-dependent Clp protease ATP-binding subunit [Dehalococcoidia bacterium]